MTYGEALVVIREDALYNPETAEIAIEAIEKQIAVHPKNHIKLGCLCPVCGTKVNPRHGMGERTQYHYCPGCGQHIDWSWTIEY